jgi:hypothetical protein
MNLLEIDCEFLKLHLWLFIAQSICFLLGNIGIAVLASTSAAKSHEILLGPLLMPGWEEGRMKRVGEGSASATVQNFASGVFSIPVLPWRKALGLPFSGEFIGNCALPRKGGGIVSTEPSLGLQFVGRKQKRGFTLSVESRKGASETVYRFLV